MDPNTMAPEHPTNKIQTWTLVLLVWTAVFSLIAVGLLLVRPGENTLSSTELSAACQNGTMNGITTNLTRISEACVSAPTENTSTNIGTSFAGLSGVLPAFTLPTNWTGTAFTNNANDPTIPFVSFTGQKGIFENCNDCGGVGFPTTFSMAGDTIANLNLVEASVAPSYSPGAIDSETIKTNFSNMKELTDIVVTKSSVGNGTLIDISGSYDPGGISEYAGVFHLLQFSNATHVVEILYQESAGVDDWNTLKSSIDWSTVK